MFECGLFFLVLFSGGTAHPREKEDVFMKAVSSAVGPLRADREARIVASARLVAHERAAVLSVEVAGKLLSDGKPLTASVLRARWNRKEKRPEKVVRVCELTLAKKNPRTTFRDEGLDRDSEYLYAVVVRTGAGSGLFKNAGSVTVPTLFSWGRSKTLLALFLFSFFYFYFIRTARRREVFLRRIAGIDAIEEAVGRATEMGKPVLYVPGLEDQTDVQTLASIVILGHVGRTTAEYGVRLVVPVRSPVVMTMAQEIVRDAYTVAGRPDAFVADDIRYLSDEQFANCAGVDGIILREKPAANLYLGTFYAESLILAETGFATGAIQVAGTASVPQIPFFIVACDYTMIGEEFYAASAYLSRDAQVVAGIKATDWFKAVLIGYFLVGLGAALLAKTDWHSEFFQKLLLYLKHPELFRTGEC